MHIKSKVSLTNVIVATQKSMWLYDSTFVICINVAAVAC